VIREKALTSERFRTLKDAYDHREAAPRKWHSEGKKIIAALGCDVPDELVLAAGFMPLRVCAAPGSGMTEADRYLEFSFDPVVRAQFERLVNGDYSELADYLAISNSTDVLVRIYFYLREIVRTEPEKGTLPIAFLDWLFTRFPIHEARNRRTLGAFRSRLEQWAGVPISDSALRESCALLNENRAALRSFSALRGGKESRVTGSEALVVIGSGFFMDKQTHTELVRGICKEAESWPVVVGTPVFVTGSVQEDTVLYDLIESAGMNVVAEDHDWGNRHMDGDVDLSLPLMDGIAARYYLRSPSSKKSFVRERVDTLCDSVGQSGADAVIFYMNLYEEAASWDYPSQKNALEASGLSTLLLAKQPWPIRDKAVTKARLERFAEQRGEENRHG
jgi:benzoyl-CoA reductase/2-hydroxyglutaryl-CoA dehydratase subunit BcrC/BadD/HgdB